MTVTILSSLLLIPAALSSPIDILDRRATAATPASPAASPILSSISTIASNIAALNATLNTFTPSSPMGLFTALQIQNQDTALANSITAAARTTNSSAVLSASDTEIVAGALLKLQPNIYSLLTNIVRHKPAFATAVFFFGDLSKTVRSDLVQQKELTRELGNALVAKFASGIFKAFAPAVVKDILAHFDTAIKAYDNCSSPVCLPDVGGLFPGA